MENLPEEKLASALKDDNPDWEYIDGGIVKLGSLAHSQLDIPELQHRGLVLLASESKDFRLLAHLLRTLQHAGDPLLALRLLALYVEHYWAVAAPQNIAHKKRFASQVIKRFEAGVTSFAESAATAQRDALLGELAKLAQCWQAHNAPELAKATDDLFALFQRAFRDVAPETSSSARTAASAPQATSGAVPDMSPHTAAAQPSVAATPIPQVIVDSHDDKAWRDTLLKVAAILCERQPDSPQGYRLRRHSLWQNITSTPQVESDGRTPLAAVSADMVSDYQSRLASADMTLWQQVEKSVLLAPYWLDGHCLSAQTALRLGYKQVADAIRDELTRFLERLPELPEMKVEVRSLADSTPPASVAKQGSAAKGFIAGVVCSAAVVAALWWWLVSPMQQQLSRVSDTAQGAATVWLALPELENYERRLQQLLDASPVQPLNTGLQMARIADSRWPESLQQQQATAQWNETLKTRAQSSPQLRGWLQARQDLHAFADLVMKREKEGVTLSYIKNVIWQAERGLGQETPVESLLTQYQDARAQGQNTDVLEKQINERLDGVLSRWLLLKNQTMPETATGAKSGSNN
ncbi:type VI secretion system protein TssA [Escherichia fergusonii]|nr:type VI secretion system protein TssA [Escherichia fergusonii]